jgi:hypothetical protein
VLLIKNIKKLVCFVYIPKRPIIIPHRYILVLLAQGFLLNPTLPPSNTQYEPLTNSHLHVKENNGFSTGKSPYRPL